MTISARIDDSGTPTLVLSGTGARPAHVTLTGKRARVAARLTGGGKTWTARLVLEAARWGGPALPLPSGAYALHVEGADGADAPVEAAIETTMTPALRLSLAGGVLHVHPPVDPAYDSGEGQAALERRYATRTGDLENAVFFESFYGRNASCNPLAIDREIARVAPGVVRYWSVVDLSVAVPRGAVAVVEGTPQWWRARGSARLLVVNDWLRRRFTRRPGQVVLQTWHGTPLKRLALHRPGFDPRRMLAVVRESRRWDVLLAQNAYGARVLRKAYAFLRRPVWVEGYPRNDALVTGDGTKTRAALGIGAGERVILYAPTWRDDRDEIVDFLDLEKLAAEVDATILVRGHSRTIVPGTDAEGSRVIDVTAYPDVSSLLVAADALVTDYSSVMFDFTATGKPIYFFTPDLADYRERLRGFYFDLAARAPGPMASTQDDLAAVLTDATASDGYAEAYARWQRQFNALDDGHASERVVARIFDQRFLDRA